MKNNESGKKENRDRLTDAELNAIRQNSDYSEGGKAAPNNNIFFEEKSNPLSSKGN